jgi:hypothetical protein
MCVVMNHTVRSCGFRLREKGRRWAIGVQWILDTRILDTDILHWTPMAHSCPVSGAGRAVVALFVLQEWQPVEPAGGDECGFRTPLQSPCRGHRAPSAIAYHQDFPHKVLI